MTLKTPICDLLSIDLPILLAGMGGVSYADVVAAVSNAGGFGTLGAASMTPDQIRDEMRKVKELTDKPFGVDLLAALPGTLKQSVDIIIKEGAKAFVSGLGVPTEIIKDLKDAGVVVAQMCGTVKHAQKGEEAGVDFVIAQGTEGGGHTGQIATMVLVPQVVQAVSIPVIAAGGICDGRGLAASLALGAQGVWMGTKFLASEEAHAAIGYKYAIVAAKETDTVITRSYTGKPLRTVKNEWTADWESRVQDIMPFPQQMGISASQGVMAPLMGDTSIFNAKTSVMAAGQGIGAIGEILPAAQIVRNVMHEARATIERLVS